MPFQRPTLDQIITRVQADFESRLQLVGAILRRAMVYVLSRVLAGAVHMLYGNLQYLGRQLFADQADLAYLIRQASIFGLSPNAAGFARATATCTGTNGSTILAGSLLQRADGAEYSVDSDVVISGGVATIAITAVVAGSAGSLTTGVVLNFESPAAGVNAATTVATDVLDGTDAEDADAFRARFLFRLQNPPQGGDANDYIAWALATPSVDVTRAWVYPLELGAGQVTVRFVVDNDAGGPIPTGGEVTAVQNYINGRAPVTAIVTVLAPVATPQAFTLHISPDNSTNRAAVTAAFADLILRLSQPGGTIPLSQVETVVGDALGEAGDFSISVPSANIVTASGHITTLGTVTFT